MPFFTSIKRPMRSFFTDVRAIPGKGEGDKRNNDGSTGSAAGSRPAEVREKIRQGPSRRALLRGMIITSKSKLENCRALGNANREGKSSGHDAEGETIGDAENNKPSNPLLCSSQLPAASCQKTPTPLFPLPHFPTFPLSHLSTLPTFLLSLI
ncbi:hypothetical protein GGR50DRAFT_377377 [Xylaria sp. CBS 124048]|nr:hypothetical protein GGR50DRAFT_377377 [Xylaria sp. CBS 124048]